jgi:AhpD family alkylhydroperoxidase
MSDLNNVTVIFDEVGPIKASGAAKAVGVSSFDLSDKVRYINLGQFLAKSVNGRTYAAILVGDGPDSRGSITLPEVIKMNGQTLAIAPQFRKLTLDNVASNWGCPFCASAHGSGGYRSTVNALRLAQNLFYYDSAAQQVFTISSTCWGSYIKAAGKAKLFIDAVALKREVNKVA